MRQFFNISLLCIVVFTGLILGPDTGLQAADKSKKNIRLESGSVAWQFEEALKWMIQTRDLVPKNKPEPFYGLEHLALSGSVNKNNFKFTIKGSVVSEEPLFVPLFGSPHQVILKNVTINDKPAIVGFGGFDYYYVRTRMQNFTVKGELALRNELSFSIPGPVNLFSTNLSDALSWKETCSRA